jgi:CubicO group peptidase (beta-lactamase class C family)
MLNKSVFLALALVPARSWTQPSSTDFRSKVDAYVAPLVDLGVFSGTVLVANGDSVILEQYYSMADIEHGIANGPRSVYRISSVSKSFTRALVGCLIDRKILSLDDPVARWLPAIPSADRMTIRMLLEHRSGIPNINSIPYDEEALQSNTLASLVDSISRRPLDFQPGTRRGYSNGGYAVAARIIELAGARAFETALEEEILTPLGLTRTRHGKDGLVLSDLAEGYAPSPEVPSTLVKAPFQEMNTKLGGGSLVSTARDLLAWSRAIGRSDILASTTWTALFPGKDSTFVFDGRSPGYNSFVLRDPRRDFTVIVLANNYAAGMVSDIAEAALALAVGSTPSPLPVTRATKSNAAEIARLAGRYDLPDGALPVPPGTVIDLRVVGVNLVAYLGAMPLDVLIPQGNGRYLARTLWSMIEASVTSEPAASLKVSALYRDSSFTMMRRKEGDGS